MLREASLIIPSYNSEKSLLDLLASLSDWSDLPKEILVIDSSEVAPILPKKFIDFFNTSGVSFHLITQQKMYPGQARNLGISKSTFEIICFLDVLTLPSNDWFEKGFQKISNKSIDGIWGLTFYSAKTIFQKIIRACTFGALPIKTLPGAFVKKNVIDTTGLFIEFTRAGEDADWMSRVQLHNFVFQNSDRPLNYNGLLDLSFLQLVKKWYRNYFFSAKLPYLTPHKDIYFYIAAIFMIIIAFNWNTLSYDPVMKGWNTASFAYIPNVTKISILFFAFFYITVRGIYLPLKKGINILFILVNLPAILFISLILDFVKSLAFLTSRVLPKKSDIN